jgi:hypothetical protein
MKCVAWWAVAVAMLVGISTVPTGAAPALKGSGAGPWPGPDPAVFLGCGEVGGPGTVVQLDMSGNVLGTIELSGTPYGLTADRNGLVAAIPSNDPRVIRIDRAGRVETLLADKHLLPAPINVTADPATGDLLVADNVSDILLLLPAGKAGEARKVLTITGHEGHCQDMSVAFARDGHLLYGGSGPIGVYRFAAGKGAALGDPLLTEQAAVAADPGSKRWAAALKGELRRFEGDKEVGRLAYPAGRQRWHDALAFGPAGEPILALHLGGTKYEVVRADVTEGAKKTLFAWDKSRVVSLAVGPRQAWKK